MAALIGCVCLFLVFGWTQMRGVAEAPTVDDTHWVAALDALWLEYEVDKEALLDDDEWVAENDEFPSDYTALAQVFDDIENTEVIQ